MEKLASRGVELEDYSHTFRELLSKADGAAKLQTSVWLDVGIVNLEISWSIHDTDVTSLQEVVDNDDMLLVWTNFDKVRANSWVNLIGVVETLWVLEIRDIELADMVSSGRCEVSVFSVFGNVGKDGHFLLKVGAEAEESLNCSLLA